MLVLSRKIGESILIDGGIEIVVTRIQGNKVCLGIAAPQSVGILRSELVKGPQADRPITSDYGRETTCEPCVV